MSHFLQITGCTDGMRWYAGSVGELVPFQGDVGNEYRSRDNGGFTNFVQYDDAIVVNESGETVLDKRTAKGK